MNTQIPAVVVAHLYEDGLHQHLRTANVQTLHHIQQGLQLIAGGGDQQRIGFFVGFHSGGCLAFSTCSATGAKAGQIGHDLGQSLGHCFGLGVFQIDNAHIARLRAGLVKARDQVFDPLALEVFAGDQNGVVALVRSQVERVLRRLILVLLLIQIAEHLHQVGRVGVLELYHLGNGRGGLIQALDQFPNTGNVLGAVGDDDGVGRVVGGQMGMLRHQWPNGRQHPRGGNVAQLNDLGQKALLGRGLIHHRHR